MPDKGLILRRLLGVLLACVLLLGATGCGKPSVPEAGPAAVTEALEKPAVPQAPASTDEPKAAGVPEAAAEPDPAKAPAVTGGTDADGQTVTYAAGYVRVTSPTRSGWLPLPAEEDYVVPSGSCGRMERKPSTPSISHRPAFTWSPPPARTRTASIRGKLPWTIFPPGSWGT